MNLEVIFLGTGTSHGVPMIGCDCEVCSSDDARDKRNRPSILIKAGGLSILVDTPPELRLSCIANGISHVDAVLFTHHHADHILGLDDVRRFNQIKDGAMPCYGTEETLEEVAKTFRYAFGSSHFGGGLPVLELKAISEGVDLDGVHIETLRVMHGPSEVTGYKIGRFAYLTDVKDIPDETLCRMNGLDTLVLGVLRHRWHPTHLSVSEAMQIIQEIKPRRVYFTHIAHDLGHTATEADLPEHIRLAYDGLRIQVEI